MVEALKKLEEFLSYPFPIAFVLKNDVLEGKTPKEKVDGLIHLAEMALQYATLIAVSDYACAEFKDERVSHRLERLRRPLTSDFAKFLSIAVPILKEHGALFVPELAEAINEATRKQVQAMRMGEWGLEERKMPLLDALVNLRNAVRHGRWVGNWEAFIEYHVPLIVEFLQLMDWFGRYPLIRLLGGGKCLRLMGAETIFTPEPIPEEAFEELARAQRAGELTGLLLADPTLSRFRTLYPFLLWAYCPYCQQEPLLGLTEEVFLFSGDEGKRYVAYIGVSHARPMSEPRERVSEIFNEKWVPPETIEVERVTYPVLYERARAQSELWLTENIHMRRYIPQVYFPRKVMESELESFLKGGKSGFLLLGESGIGKTNLLCHKVDEWCERGEIVLFYAGHKLNLDKPIEQHLLGDLHLQGDFIRLLEFVRKEGRRFIVVVDGVNENEQSAKLLRYLCEFVQRYGRNFPLKVILSVRSVFFTRMLQALGEGRSEEQLKSIEAGLFPSMIFQTHTVEREGRREETHRFELGAVDEDELQGIYEGYRAFEGYWTEEGRLRRFRPTTPYEGLTPQVRQVIRHPWLLRMVMEAYDGKPIPEKLWMGDILNAFCDAKIFRVVDKISFEQTDQKQKQLPSRHHLVINLVRLMREHKRDYFLRDELHDFSAEWSRVLLERELTISPYLQLLDEGVLMETPIAEEWGRFRRIVGYQVRFAFDMLFEFLLYQELLEEGGKWKGLTGEKVAKWLSEGREFDHLTGAVMILLTEAVQEGNLNLVAETLNASDIELAEPVIIEVLMTLEGLKDERFEPLLNELAKKADGEKALRVFVNASYQFGIKQRHRSMLACTERAERLAKHLVEVEGRVELENDLAMALVNKGVALQRLGHLSEAVDCYEEAIGIYWHIVEEGKENLENELVKALVNKGAALWQMGRHSEALDCYDEAIRIIRRLAKAERQGELEDELARALVNKGSALTSLGRLSEAINCWDEAIRIYRYLTEVEGLKGLESELVLALMNKGVGLFQLGHLDEAIKCYNEAIGIVERLVEIEGRKELEGELAMTLMNKGIVLGRLGRLNEAINCYDEAIRIHRRLIEVEGRKEMENELVTVLVNRGIALLDLGRLSEAIDCFDEAIGIGSRLVEEGRVELESDLASALMNKGNILLKLGHLVEAIHYYDEALEIYRRIVEERKDLENELARVLVNKGIALRQLGRLSEAIDCFDESIGIRRHLVEVKGQEELKNDLAVALVNKGNALSQLHRLSEAIDCYEEAIGIRRRLVEEGRVELSNELASALVNKGNALWGLGRHSEAIDCYDEAIKIYRRLVEVEGRVELANYLAGALVNKGNALSQLRRLSEAIDCCDEAIGIYRRLVEVEGRVELANDLASALMNKGVALWNLGRLSEAIDCYDEAIGIRRRLVEVEGRVELANDLAGALVIKGVVLWNLGHHRESIDCYDEAIKIYRRLVEVEGRVELANDLAKALMNKGVALSDLGYLKEALQCYDEGIGFWEMMMAEGKVHVAPLLIKGLGIRFELKRQMGDWDGAVEDVRKVLDYLMLFISSDSLTEALEMEFVKLIRKICEFTDEEWSGIGVTGRIC
jgi:tetratricopeptide (TPR) repeat protein